MLWWAASIPVYTGVKSALIDQHGFEDAPLCHVASSVASGFAGTFVSCPMDVVKTRLQNQDQAAPRFRNTAHCFCQIVADEGPAALWRGLVPRYARLGPWQLIFFVIYEQALKLTTGATYDRG